MKERRTIEVGAIARVEGEGALHITFDGGRVADLRLEIYEPPRFFESFLRGRSAREIPDLVARICGICPVAYQMSAVHALEKIFGVEIAPGVRALRRLYYAGEWIESHLLHMTFLAAPDYLGLDDAMAIAKSHKAEVERSLRIRRVGIRILELLGGRAINPVGVRIGGFSRTPSRGELEELRIEALRGRAEAEVLLRWFSTLPVPRRPQQAALVALQHPREYPMNEGRIASSEGLDIDVSAFPRAFDEKQVPHSTALHCEIRGRGCYLVGPLARVALNADRLLPAASAALETLSERFEEPDPASSVFARGIEVLQAFDEALVAIDNFEAAGPDEVEWTPRKGKAAWATEAPRGTLWMEISTESSGAVEEIRIVPPTSQNLARIEEDLIALATSRADAGDDELRRSCEAAIRDYDPCISCATHFLKLHVERGKTTCGSL